jgi:transposase-like protein
MKTCTRCGIEKPIEEFYKNKNYKDGNSYECKSCNSERSKKYYLENTEKARALNKKWRIENPEREKKIQKNGV